MGNFGKRLLIVLLSAVAFVTLALVGNAYQQAERLHKVSKQSDVIYNGSYDGKSYSLTKEDAWKAIIASDATDNIVEMLNMYLLQSVINSSWTDDKILAKRNFLTYGTTDPETIAEYQKEENSESNEKLIKTFEDKMVVLGYTDKGEAGHTITDYCKYLLACDKYAKYRLEQGLEISGTKYDLSDDTLKETYNAGYKDTYAIAIKFYSTSEATDFIVREDNKLAVVSSEIRFYVGDQKYKVESVKDCLSNDTALEENYNYVQTVLVEDNPETEENEEVKVNVPNASVATKTVDGKTVYETLDASVYNLADTYKDQGVIWKSSASTDTSIYALYFDATNKNWYRVLVSHEVEHIENEGTEEETKTKVVEFDSEYEKNSKYSLSSVKAKKDATIDSSNTVELSDAQFLALYVYLYNEFYKKQGKSVPTTVTEAMFGDLANADLQAKLKDLGYAVVDNHIVKYVGNEEYVVDIENSKEGFPVYKKYTSNDTEKDLPNYKVEMDGDSVKLDSDGNLVYVLDGDGNKIANDSKKEIKDVTEFNTSNTINANDVQLYALYIILGIDTNADYSNIKYNYEELNASRSGLASQIFVSLSINTAETYYLHTATDLESTTGTNDPYYLVFKLSDSKLDSEPTEDDLKAIKEDKINDYLIADGFVDACMAELRGEAGLVFYDKYFAFDYEKDIAYDSSSNTYGVNDEDSYKDYFKKKSYKAKKVAALTKKVKVEALGIDCGKYAISTDDLYEYSMAASGASYISNAAAEKITLELMDEFTQIHGKNKNYLTSKNWLMELYSDTIQSYNQNYEYYKQLYAAYGYDYYDSVSEYLYAYGVRSYDDMVKQLEKSTMKNILIYKELVGALTDTALTEYGKAMTLNNDNFKAITEDYLSLDVNHLLFGIDLDEDGSPDDFDEFQEKLVNNETGLVFDTDETYETVINELYVELTKYVDKNATSLSTLTSALSNFVTEYNNSSRLDGDYKKFKELGITLTNESFEITRTTLSNYDEKFQAAVTKLQEKLVRTDNDLLGYSIYDGLCRSSFGDHYIVASPCETLVAPSFKYSEDTTLFNDVDGITEKQLVLYIQQSIYTTIFGNTDNPKANAKESGYGDFEYPNLPTTLTTNIESLYGDYINLLLDKSYSYHTTYIVLSKLVADKTADAKLQASLEALKDIYYNALIED